MSSKDVFYNAVNHLVAELINGRLSAHTTDQRLLFSLAESLCNLLYVRQAALPLTKGLSKVADACGETPARDVASVLVTLLKTRVGPDEPAHAHKRDIRTGTEYVSISPHWWAVTKLESALLFTEE